MYAEQRRQLLVEHARAHGQVQVGEAAATFDVTPETIRRDLESLDRAGILRRVHGGAMPSELLPLGDRGLPERERTASAEKERIAHAARELLPTDDDAAILVDAGTTTARFARLIPARSRFTVFTNSLPVATTLSSRTECTVELLGGRVKGVTQACVGGRVLSQLARLRVDIAFLGTNGLTETHGLSTPDDEEAMVKAGMVASARRNIVLTDASKFGIETAACFARLDEIDGIVTDAATPPQREIFRHEGIEVYLA